MSSKKTALLIDANALIHRAWHALPPMTDSGGRMVNAVYGFAAILIKILGTEKPDVLVACWDTPEQTFRHKALERYKAQRKEQPEAFYDQFPLAKDLFFAMGGTNVEFPGFEADDLLGTFGKRLERKSFDVTILTGDRDAFQLISEKTHVLAFKKGVSETIRWTPEVLFAETGLHANQIVDYKAMRGDTSDNVPGVSGIGEKTATDLLQTFGDLQGIFKAAHDPTSKIADGVRKKLLAGERMAEDLLPIVRIVTDVPLEIEDSALVRRPADAVALQDLFERLGFKSLMERVFGKPAKKEKPSSPAHKGHEETKRVGSAEMVSDLYDLLSQPTDGKTFILHVPEEIQTSMFQASPALIVSDGVRMATVSREALDQKPLRADLSRFLDDARILKAGHGMKRVCHWVMKNGFSLNGISFDTELAAYLLAAGERGHDLVSVASAFLHRTIDPTVGTEVVSAIADLIPLLADEMEKKLLRPVFDRMELPLIPILARMERIGILIDRAYLKDLSASLSKEKQTLEAEMQALAGEPFNPLSPKQLGHILFDVLALSSKGVKRGKTGISTAAAELEKLHDAHPIIALIEQYRELSKLLSTYVDALPRLADADGRVHTTFNQAVTATGRLSSSEPNLQNIPIRTEIGRKVRRAFVAKPGHVLLACDYSQIELRIVAALAKDERMLAAFAAGEDIHTATAANIWNINLKEVTKDQRRVAKAINFGLIFGQGPQGLSRAADISVDEARDFIDRYFAAYAGIRAWMDTCKALAASQGYVETLFGRRRPLPDIRSPLPQIRAQAERMAINMPVQGTEADLIKLAMIRIAQDLPKISADTEMLLQVHDELVFEVPEADVERVASAAKDIMEHVERIGCPIVVDAKVGTNWEEMKVL